MQNYDAIVIQSGYNQAVADVQERFRDAGPALVLTWHIGAIFGVSAALHAIGADPLILREPYSTV